MNGNRRTLLGLALLGLVDPALASMPASNPAARRHRQVTRTLAALVDDPACQLASLSVLAIRDGQIAYEQQFGRRWIGQDGAADVPATPATRYRIASVSKFMTTLGLMRLVEQGQLDLDADASDYLGFTLRNPHFAERAITLRHLLSHRASLRDDAGYAFPAGVALREFLVPGAPLYGDGKMWATHAGPGDYFTYCNLNWGLIGTLMERVTGERFDRLMQRLLLQPLGLSASYNPAEMPAAALAELATLYRKRTVDTEIWDPHGPWIAQADDYSRRPAAPPTALDAYRIGSNATPFSPTGGLRISARELASIMLMLMHDGQHAGQRILQSATLAQMFARQWTATGNGANGDTLNGAFQAWGLGNAQFPNQPGMRLLDGAFDGVGHLGDAYGLRSVFVLDRQRRNGLIVLTGGTSSDPEQQRGRYAGLARFEEQILRTLYEQVIAN